MNASKKMQILCFYLACILSLHTARSIAQTINPDSTRLASKHLEIIKQKLLSDISDPGQNRVPIIQRMLDLGMWKEASYFLAQKKLLTSDYQLLQAEYFIHNNEFNKAENLVNEELKKHPENEKAVFLKVGLEIHAWRLAVAAALCEKAIKKKPSEKLQLMLGRVRLLQKNYKEALIIATSILSKNPNSAEAYLLEADVYFWDQKPELAEPSLRRSIEIDPYNADARFSYGYAIWRRIDATQLNAMAAQWDLALAINPLHYQTHWHWGNGHTNLTYADYAKKDDEQVRKTLDKADELVRLNKTREAINYTLDVQKEYPASVLPAMHRASVYYIASNIDRQARLDSAENIFREVLSVKKHYGPAHNGLSAVIKSKRIAYLTTYDSIINKLNHTQITDMENFRKVFPDVSYYPGETIKAMAWNQLYASVVYFPFLTKQNNVFRIPSLHKDLAITMNSPSFRYMTTFDNRQWMDIRGVGSGAAAIEYVERGAFQERNVILHEYVHLFHGRVLTDAENRRIRALYYKAMKENRTLDYYSQNNESEYFAQTYPAYFEPVKVHPLDFKSMNTASDLKNKDPDMYRFIDQLVKKEKAYLAGDQQAMASNWSQVYVNLSARVKQKDPQRAIAYLDTALHFDPKYLPAYLDQAQLRIEKYDFQEAEKWIKKAEVIDQRYAPVYTAYSTVQAARFAAGELDQKTAVKEQTAYLKKSFELEDDYAERARINTMLREMYKDHGMIAEAIESADEYGRTGASISTYLRDERDEAIAFAALLKSLLGYIEPLAVLKKFVEQKPQNFEYRNMYADALSDNKQYEEAIQTLKAAQRILAASGNSRSDYRLRIAEFYTAMGKTDSAAQYLQPFLKEQIQLKELDKLRYVRLLSISGDKERAEQTFKTVSLKGTPFYLSEYHYTHGILLASSGQSGRSMSEFEKAIEANPYFINSYTELVRAYTAAGQEAKANALREKMKSFVIKAVPDYQR